MCEYFSSAGALVRAMVATILAAARAHLFGISVRADYMLLALASGDAEGLARATKRRPSWLAPDV